MQNRVLRPADIEINRQPFFDFFGAANSFLFFGSAKRKKYQEEQTNVSIVSVSRFAVPPHFGQVVFTKSGFVPSGEVPFGAIESFSLSAKIHRQIFFRNRDHLAQSRLFFAQFSQYNRNRRTPISLPRNQPVTKLVCRRFSCQDYFSPAISPFLRELFRKRNWNIFREFSSLNIRHSSYLELLTP